MQILVKANSNQMAEAGSGADLAFSKLSFEVTLSDGNKKSILSNISGYIKGGDMMYLMGPSGAGKSSLLDALADRVKAPVTGTVTVNGKLKDPLTFRKISKYVQQEDSLIPVLTVRQTFACLASFYTTSNDTIRQRTEEALSILGLEAQANTIIGGPLLRGLSGGQKRRVSIGCELVAMPQLMFLDEPTSGLDSTAAWNVVSALKSIASKKGTSLIITIHQPSEKLFAMSDRFLLLAAGRLAYMGDTSAAVPHFEALGHKPPPMTSSADWMLDLVDTSFSPLEQVQPLLDAWGASAAAAALQGHLQALEAAPAAHPPADPFDTSLLWQIRVLTWRMGLNIMKNPAVIWLRFAMYLALSILIGTVWLDIGESSDAILDIINVIFFIAAFMVFMSISVLPAFLEEKSVFIKERANGAYSVAAFNIAHLFVDLPPLLVQAVVNGAICYFLIGLNDASDRFGFFILDLFLSFAVAEALCFLVAVVVPNFIVGIAAGAFVYGGFMVVQGFFIKVESIGWYWRWMHYIGLHSYSFSAFMYNEFEGKDFSCAEGRGIWPCVDGVVPGETVLEYYSFDDTDKWANMVVLVAMMLVYRLVAAAWMWHFHTGKK